MEQYWVKIKEFQGVQLLRDPETMQCRIMQIERQQPQKTAEPVYSQAALESTERAVKLRQLMMDAKITTSPHVIEPKPVLTFEERIKEDWRTRPDIRAEFVSFASYAAFMKAVQAGKVKRYGKA